MKAMTSLCLFGVLLAAKSSASLIYTTSYNDHSVNLLALNGSSLSVVDKDYNCGSEPTWLTLNPNYGRTVLYCLNEGWGGNASITTYQVRVDGTLNATQILPVLRSPVASNMIDSKNLAVAF